MYFSEPESEKNIYDVPFHLQQKIIANAFSTGNAI